ncbi:MAG: hypothetical protein AAB930_02755 [Patescibacteria group bacterium]
MKKYLMAADISMSRYYSVSEAVQMFKNRVEKFLNHIPEVTVRVHDEFPQFLEISSEADIFDELKCFGQTFFQVGA